MAAPLARWDPFTDLADLRGRFDRLLDELGGGRGRAWMPAVDVVRKEDGFVIRADVPGLKPEEVSVEVEGGVLTVSGEHEESKEEQEKEFVRRERRYGSFSRSIALPEGVDPDAITAEVRHGVLEVTVPVPKAAEAGKRTITPTTAD